MEGETPDNHIILSRRAFLGKVLLAGAGLTVGSMGLSNIAHAAQAAGRVSYQFTVAANNPGFTATPQVTALREDVRKLAFYHTHTEQDLELTYAVGNQYNSKALKTINHYLADFRTGEVHRIDPELLDILWALQQRCARPGVFSVISAFRSPLTNKRMRKGRRSGVARKSLHMEGKAIDVRFTDVPLEELRDYAIDLQAGGVGFYPASDFIHLDTGDVRTW